MSRKVVVTDYRDALSVKVGKFFLEKGFSFANHDGHISERIMQLQNETTAYRLVYEDTSNAGKDLLGFLNLPRTVIVGIATFTTENSVIVTVQGSQYLEMMKSLAKEISEKFDTSVTVHLEQGNPGKVKGNFD